MRIQSLVVAAAVLWSCCGPTASQDGPPGFAGISLAEAKEQARAKARVVLIDFSTSACEPCRRLATSTWVDPAVQEWIGKHAVAVRVDPEADRALAAEHRIDAYPTVVVLGSDGAELGRVVGFVDPGGMLRRMGELGEAESKDFKVRQDLGDALRDQGDHAGALRHYLWCWDHGLKHNPSYVGVRVSFFLRKFADLAKVHPPAREAMEARRNAAEERVLAGDTSLATVTDMTRLNEHLEARERSLAVLDKVPDAKWKRDRIAKGVVFDSVLEVLHESKRYADILRLMGNPEQSLDQALASLSFPGLPEEFRADQRERIVDKFACIAEAYYGTGEDKAAAALAERLLSVRAHADTWVTLIEAAKRAGNAVASHDLAVRALRELPEDQQAGVRRALRQQ